MQHDMKIMEKLQQGNKTTKQQISINDVGSKYKTTRQDRKVM